MQVTSLNACQTTSLPMLIGFMDRKITLQEHTHDYNIDVASERTSERPYTVVFIVEEANRTATVGTEGQASSQFDVVFGERLSSDGPIQKIMKLAPGEDEIRLLVEIVNDLLDESEECFIISISSLPNNDFMCIDSNHATNYFCNFMLCIVDDNKLNVESLYVYIANY